MKKVRRRIGVTAFDAGGALAKTLVYNSTYGAKSACHKKAPAMQKHGVAPTVLATLCHAGTCCYNCGEGPTVSKPAINQRRANGSPRCATCSRANSTVGTNDVSRVDPTFTRHPVVVELSRNRNAPLRPASKKPLGQRTITRLKTSKLAAQALGVATSPNRTNPRSLGATKDEQNGKQDLVQVLHRTKGIDGKEIRDYAALRSCPKYE